MTWTKQLHRLSILLIVLGLTLGVASISHAQRFVRPINSLPELIVSNPNDPHTNVFIPQGPTGPGLFYQWRKNDAAATNDNLSVLGSDWPGASGRWYKIPISGLSGDGISNPGTNDFAVVNTLADLRNIPGDLGIGMVYVRGHSLPGDWGRGFFSRRDDCSIPDDDAYSIHGNSGSTCWKRESDFPWAGIPVQYFGGTISINNINRATAFLASIGGGTAFITDGEWPVFPSTDGPILGHNNVTIAGSASALLVGDDTGTMVDWTNVINGAIIQVGISNVLNAVVIRGGTNILIGGNAISDVGDGVRQYGGDNVRIENNIFAAVTNGIHFSLDGAVKVTQAAVIGNTFSSVDSEDVLIDAGSISLRNYRRIDSQRVAFTDGITIGRNSNYEFGGAVVGNTFLESWFDEGEGDPNLWFGSLGVKRTDDTAYSILFANGTGYGSFLSVNAAPTNLSPSVSFIDMTADTNRVRFRGAYNNLGSGGVPSSGTWNFTPYYLSDASPQTAYTLSTAHTLTNVESRLFSIRYGNTNRLSVGWTGFLEQFETVAPATPVIGYGHWYASSADSKPHYLSDDGTDYDLAGATINPTTGRLPYRQNSTTFGDSPWYRISTNRMGFNGTTSFIHGTDSIGGASASVGLGTDTLKDITSGVNNTAIGYQALNLLTTGDTTTAVGQSAGAAVTTVSENTFIGANAGVATTGAANTYIGAFSGGVATTATRAIAIGRNAESKGTDTANIGDTLITVLWLGEEVGWFKGNGSPESVITAPVGSFYSRKDGGAGTSYYVKESGTGNTGWVGK